MKGGAVMPRTYNQKLKLLYLRDYLLRSTDEDHAVTIQDMIDMLARHEIRAERKSLYDDLRLLGPDGYGMDIIHSGKYYKVVSRDFELQEVKLLVDMVQSSNFITSRKTSSLIAKLETLCSRFQAARLQRTVYVRNRVKNMDESVYLNVDAISEAISEDRQICFQYFSYNTAKERVLRHGGRVHTVSPFALIWVDQNYYLLAWFAESGELRHYRVDRMTRIRALRKRREGREAFAATDMATYTTKVFSMFTGEATQVRLRFADRLTDPVLDRFGTDVILAPEEDGHFTVTVEVVVSPQFYAWVTAFGEDAEILGPPSVREGCRKHLAGVLKQYET